MACACEEGWSVGEEEGMEVWSQPQEKPSPERGQLLQFEVCRGHGHIVEEFTNLIGLNEGPIKKCRQIWC